jgi:hypothetical protein
MLVGVLWSPLVPWLIWKLPGAGESRMSESTLQVAFISLTYPIYYMAVSWAISVIHWRKRWQNRRRRV